jgi:segregation and condensation protein B
MFRVKRLVPRASWHGGGAIEKHFIIVFKYMSLTLSQQIESILFYKTEPVSYTWLANFLDVSTTEIDKALRALQETLTDRGIVLVNQNNTVVLGTHPECSSLIEKLHTKEVTSELSRAALETLAMIVYRGSATKAELDYIRGVNSQFMLRNLLIRGLITKEINPDDKRRALYTPTHDTLSFLGVTDRKELPGYEEYITEINTKLASSEQDQ